jgi:hypothetical protein
MEIKIGVYLAFFLLTVKFSLVNAQFTEDQRKYNVTNIDSVETVLKKSTMIGDFTFINHSKDIYYDIYLDSPDFVLKNHGFSLRFRKRISQTNDTSYAFQLKSEISSVNSIRMEVEESDLSMYTFIQDSSVVTLIQLLEPLFDFAQTLQMTTEVRQNIQTLSEWISFKSEAPILPFQLLKNNSHSILTSLEIATLRPILVGKSQRTRYHGVIDESKGDMLIGNVEKNSLPRKNLPAVLQDNPTLNWIFEASLDYSVFSAFDKGPSILLTELEIENKFNPPAVGVEQINTLEKIIVPKFGLTKGKLSKYAHAIELLAF